jgi:hypothetical protein
MRECQIIFSSSFAEAESMLTDALSDYYSLTVISVRELLKQELNKTSHKTSAEIKAILKTDSTIPDSYINRLVENEIDATSGGILVLHYPRTRQQYTLLKKLLEAKQITISKFWYLKATNLTSKAKNIYLDAFEEVNTLNEPGIVRIIEFNFPIVLDRQQIMSAVING